MGNQKPSSSSDHCSSCRAWIHSNDLCLDEYQHLHLSKKVWFCNTCIANIFPFTFLDRFEFNALMISRKPSDVNLLPSFDIMSQISGLKNLDMSDVESNIPINSKY